MFFETLLQQPRIHAGAVHALTEFGHVHLTFPRAAHGVQYVVRLHRCVGFQPFAKQILYFQRQSQQHVAGDGRTRARCHFRIDSNSGSFSTGIIGAAITPVCTPASDSARIASSRRAGVGQRGSILRASPRSRSSPIGIPARGPFCPWAREYPDHASLGLIS